MSIPRKIVVVGGTGLIGSKVVSILTREGHQAIVAVPSAGINSVTGEGLAAALAGAHAVIDVSNIMSFDASVVRNFFESSSRNLTAAEKDAGVHHHVVLSIVGADGLAGNPYMAGKVAQEDEVKRSGQAYTVLRATQFFEFIPTLADAYTADGTATVPATLFQPVAADDVAAALVETALRDPQNSTIQLAGPDRLLFADIVATYLRGVNDTRRVTADASASYFGSAVTKTSLVPTREASIGTISLNEWLERR
ncbi:SDR family oxidoreductase [Rhizobium sp. Leaf383]|uniref:SDR family oxidoreductase n=1 Tax=Rhizobium sp. Leaf383 TaxID=1736357 RepID=UPI0007128FBB|nr:SDR family oxidoreductase [Rhizobium sp. Leaf383]KQS76421.1 NmrA family transcriptional regulator [Rhizobium sp. Leaf383]